MIVGRHQVGNLVVRDGTAISSTRERRQDPAGTRGLFSRARWLAGKDTRAGWRLGALRIEGPLDADRQHVWRAFCVEWIGEVANEALQAMGFERGRCLLEEGRGDVALARLDEFTHAQASRFDVVRGVGRIGLQRDQVLLAAELTLSGSARRRR